MSDDPACLGLVGHDRRDGGRELRFDLLKAVGLEHACLSLDHLGERPEAHAFAVRQRAPLAPQDQLGVDLDGREELADEPALADAGDADERDELRRPFAPNPLERVAERLELTSAADERRCIRLFDVHAESRPCLHRLPDVHRLRLALRVDRVGLAVLDRRARPAIGRFAHEDPVDGCRALQPCGSVDDVARRHRLTEVGPGGDVHERLTRRNPDPHLEALGLARPVADCERGPDGALRIVLVSDRRAEQRHHGVADELLHRPAEALELEAKSVVVRREDRFDVLRIEGLGTGCEADEIGEEDGDDLPLFAGPRHA